MQYDKNRFKIHALPHPLVLHWVLNPVVMFGELIFGVRVAKVTLIEIDKKSDKINKKSDKPQMERTYIPCPHCETLNDRRLWANDFGNWFGFVCPSCHEIIPCLWNIFSLAVLAVTFPLWCFPARFFRRRWLEKEKERLAKSLEHPLIQAKSINSPLIFFMGIFVAGVFAVIFEVLLKGKEWDLKTMLEILPICMVAGFVTGLINRWIEEDEERKERLANVPERPLIQAIQAKSIKWFVRGTFYLGGFVWVVFAILEVLEGGDWDSMFDMLPFCLLLGFISGAFMYVCVNLTGRKARRHESD